MHHRAAGKVQRSHLPEVAAGCGNGICLRLSHAGRVRIRARPVPDHVGDRKIAESEPEGQEQQHCGELDALDDGAEDQAARDGCEGGLESDVDELVQHYALAERGRRREVAGGRIEGPIEEHASPAADEGITLGESQRVAVDAPQHGDQRETYKHLHEHRQHVLRADQAAIEQCECRHGHEQHEGGRGQHPGCVALVGDRRSGGIRRPGQRGSERRERDARQ